MFSKHALLPLASVCACVAAVAGVEGQRGSAVRQAKTTLGVVAGAPGRNPEITVYKGIPFAAPPVGNLRWRAPHAATPWQGVRRADAFGPNCVQTILDERKPWTYEFMAHGEVSEDCLHLNVWTGARAASERRPVFVFIHGGANTEGSGSVPAYDGEGLAAKGLVVVTINYRLGVLGFLSHPELHKEAAYQASGNYGLLDQIAAVRWVRENAEAFGGDSNRITVAGQSAGASAVHNLTASPLARGLFHRAIAQSGSGISGGPGMVRTLADQEADGLRFAEAKGAASMAVLRAMRWQDVVSPVQGGAPFRFGIVIDGYALPASVRQIFTEGKQNDVPTLTGANADEGGASPQPNTTLETFRQQARQRYGASADEFLKLYPAATDDEARRAQNESARDQTRVSMYLWALNRAKTARTPAFTYFWTHPLPGPDAAQFGAFHTSEVPYVLDTLAMSTRPFTERDRAIASTLSSYWANFAESGDPNGRGLPPWDPVSVDWAATMEVGEKFERIPVASSEARLAFFKRFLLR